MSQYNINPINRGVNNFFESLTNSSNPRYIQPVQQPISQSIQQPVYPQPSPLVYSQYNAVSSGPLPTVTYTPTSLQSSFVPLNSNYK
jgi:hypothetical protein